MYALASPRSISTPLSKVLSFLLTLLKFDNVSILLISNCLCQTDGCLIFKTALIDRYPLNIKYCLRHCRNHCFTITSSSVLWEGNQHLLLLLSLAYDLWLELLIQIPIFPLEKLQMLYHPLCFVEYPLQDN